MRARTSKVACFRLQRPQINVSKPRFNDQEIKGAQDVALTLLKIRFHPANTKFWQSAGRL
jgi:hypothetical protein